MAGDHPGRKHKGARRYVGFKMPASLAEDVIQRAAESGLTVTDYLGNVIAQAHGYPLVRVPQPAGAAQTELQLGA